MLYPKSTIPLIRMFYFPPDVLPSLVHDDPLPVPPVLLLLEDKNLVDNGKNYKRAISSDVNCLCCLLLHLFILYVKKIK